jgi:hypothetical protein
MNIYSKEFIKTRAHVAAAQGPHGVNPFPADSEAHALFAKYFEIERAQLARENAIQIAAAKSIQEYLAA